MGVREIRILIYAFGYQLCAGPWWYKKMSALVWNELQLTAEDRHKHITTLTQKGKPDSAESIKSLPKWCHLSLTLQDGTHKFLVVRGKRDGRQRKFCKANKYWNWSARTVSGTERNWGMESQTGLEGLSLSLLEMEVVRSSSQKGRVNVQLWDPQSSVCSKQCWC